MRIAPGIDDADWKRLQLDTADHPDWQRAVDIFDRRLRSRFTDVVEFLIVQDESRKLEDRRFGFAILALDCLIVETLEAFRQGLVDTSGQSKRLCVSFLTQRPQFQPFFDELLAKRFYEEFRCGLVHNTQVFGTGLVWSVGPLVRLEGTAIIVNRSEFHKALMREFNDYLHELRVGTQARLRTHFRAKMDFIADAKFQK